MTMITLLAEKLGAKGRHNRQLTDVAPKQVALDQYSTKFAIGLPAFAWN